MARYRFLHFEPSLQVPSFRALSTGSFIFSPLCRFLHFEPYRFLHFEPSLDALSVRSDVISSLYRNPEQFLQSVADSEGMPVAKVLSSPQLSDTKVYEPQIRTPDTKVTRN